MIVSMIVAMAEDRVIGKDNQMPWYLPADFAWFKRCTLGKPIIMGRKTYESIGRLLPGRQNVIISRDQNYTVEGGLVVSSIDAALVAVDGAEEVMIIGGGNIYQAYLPLATRLYITHVDLNVEGGDTRFPDIGAGWTKVFSEHCPADEKNVYNMEFTIFERTS